MTDQRRLITIQAELYKLAQALVNLESRMRSWSVSLRVLSLDVETVRGIVAEMLRADQERGALIAMVRSEAPAHANRRDFPKEPGPSADSA